MKKFWLFIYFGLIVVALSCTKGIEPSPDSTQEMVELTISTAAAQTKVREAPLEDGIKFLQVFIFSDGRLESVGSSVTSSVTLKCFKGDKDIYALANHSEIEWTSSMTASDLLETVFRLDGGVNTMFGKMTVSSKEFPSSLSATVYMTVRRVAARFVLNEVINSTEDSGGGEVKICGAYLINVVNYVKLCDLYSETAPDQYAEPEFWYNKTKYEGEMDELLYSGEMDKMIGIGGTATVDRYFYCYPNFTETDSQTLYGDKGIWASRFTRLVMEAEYDGDSVNRYYVVSINGVRSNYSYEVTFEITGPGADKPEIQGNVYDGHLEGSGGGGDSGLLPNDPVFHSNLLSARDDEGTVVYFHGGCAKVKECGL